MAESRIRGIQRTVSKPAVSCLNLDKKWQFKHWEHFQTIVALHWCPHVLIFTVMRFILSIFLDVLLPTRLIFDLICVWSFNSFKVVNQGYIWCQFNASKCNYFHWGPFSLKFVLYRFSMSKYNLRELEIKVVKMESLFFMGITFCGFL